MACVVCDGNDLVTSTNPTFVCEDCGISVHKLCYGITAKSGNIDPWWCSPCGLGQRRGMCKLCLEYGGALKKTTCGHWVHVVCALFTEGTIFMNKQRMEPINISSIPQENHGQNCVFCSEVRGICSKCSDPDCGHFLHITCGQKYNCLREKNNSRNTKIIFEAYCHQHKPKSSHRLSSVFVVDTLEAKNDLPGQNDCESIETSDISSDTGDGSVHSAANNSTDGENGVNEIVTDHCNTSCSINDASAVNSDTGDGSLTGDSCVHSAINISTDGENGVNDIVTDHFNASCSINDVSAVNSDENARSNDDNSTSDLLMTTIPGPVSDASFIRHFWWDYFEFQTQLRSKDAQIEKVKNLNFVLNKTLKLTIHLFLL